jgi:hypothetical protein
MCDEYQEYYFIYSTSVQLFIETECHDLVNVLLTVAYSCSTTPDGLLMGGNDSTTSQVYVCVGPIWTHFFVRYI